MVEVLEDAVEERQRALHFELHTEQARDREEETRLQRREGDQRAAVPLFEAQITILTTFPGTPLYDRLLAEGRILEPGRWDLCTLFDVNHRPTGMSVEELRAGMRWLSTSLYSREALEARRRPFFDGLRQGQRRRAA